MLTGKYISSAAIVEKLFSVPYGFPPQHIQDIDVYELIYTAMALIGDPTAMLDKVALIQIASHRGDLPCDLFSIDKGGVRLYPAGTVFDLDTNLFYQDVDYGNTVEDDLPDEDAQQIDIDGVTTYIKYFDQDIETLTTGDSVGGDYVYNIDNEKIIVGITSGTVEMAYVAFPTEPDGNKGLRPKIPDNERYIKGVTAYVAEQIAMYLWMKDLLSERKYKVLSQESAWYMGSASNVGRIPSLDKAEVIKNIQLSLISDPNQHKQSFKRLYKPNLIRTHNSRRRR